MTEETTTARKKPGRKPRPAVTDTPEFKAAVAKVAADAVAAALSGLQGKFQAAGGEATPGNTDWMQQLAITLAEIGNQGTGRKTVAPHILKQRADARDRMIELILAAKAERRPATYQLRNKVLLNNRLIEPFWIASDHTTKPTEIDWAGIPNDAMIPVNDTAKEIHRAFLDSIGTIDKEHQIPEDKLGVTPGGLVVRNSAVTATVQKRTGTTDQPTAEAPQVGAGEFGEDESLTVHHTNQPGRYKEVNVLGTIQEPARQAI